MNDPLLEVRLTGRTVYEGTILDVEVDQVRLPNGSETEREIVRHRGAAVVLPLHGDGRIILVNQYRYAAAECLLELPAGKIDSGESPRSCAVRELEEETGWRPGAIHRLGEFFTTPGFSDERIFAFVATHLEVEDDIESDPDESLEIVTLETSEVLAAVREGTIRDAKTIATLLLAQLHGYLKT